MKCFSKKKSSGFVDFKSKSLNALKVIISKVFLNKKIVLLCAKAKELKEKCIYKNIRCCRFVEMYQATYNAYLNVLYES